MTVVVRSGSMPFRTVASLTHNARSVQAPALC